MLRKKTTEIFGADNWLEEELRRESRISAWDMDGGRQLRLEHEENCDARNLAAEHALDCETEENAARHREEHRAEDLSPGYRNAFRAGNQTQEKSGTRKLTVWMIFAILFGIMILTAAIPFIAPLIPIAAFFVAKKANRKG